MQAARYGDRALLVAGEERWSFAETAEIAAASARLLADTGIQAGDRVAILCSNRPEFLRVYLGCAWLGAIAVPINIALRGSQLAHVFRNAAPRLLAVEDELEPVLGTMDAELLPFTIWWVGEGDLPSSCPAGSRRLPLSGDLLPAPLVRPGDTVAILYTSGTTGPSKGVCCPQAQLFWWGVYSAQALGIREGDVLATSLPLFHTNALNTFYQALVNGCTYVLLPRFSASRFWDEMRQHRATVGYLLGAMAAILLAQPERPDDCDHNLRVALGGGVPGPLHEPFARRFGVPLMDGYASTETNLVFATPIPADQPGSMGYLLDHAEARIVDENDTPLPDGEAGELVLRAREPFSFATGYFAMPDKTVEAWRNLWFHTGDRVVRQADGNYRFIDRTKDAIRRRGENVSSWEVEQVLTSHAAVAACAVYPLPSDLGEDEVAAAVQLEPGHSVKPEELLAHCEGKLAYFAIPRFVRFLPALPLTENGKIRKVVLREQGRTEDCWDREAAGYRVRR